MPTKIIVNCETGEHTVVELTAEEIAVMNEDSERYESEMAIRQAEAEEKEQARASAVAKLAKLGLTEAEISALIQ